MQHTQTGISRWSLRIMSHLWWHLLGWNFLAWLPTGATWWMENASAKNLSPSARPQRGGGRDPDPCTSENQCFSRAPESWWVISQLHASCPTGHRHGSLHLSLDDDGWVCLLKAGCQRLEERGCWLSSSVPTKGCPCSGVQMKAEGPGRQQCGDHFTSCHVLFRHTHTPHSPLISPSHHRVQTFFCPLEWFLPPIWHPLTVWYGDSPLSFACFGVWV